MYTLRVIVDFRKAFDTVCHSSLISKLEQRGVRGIVLELLRHDLTNRCQYVGINNDFSSYAEITTGVPQGSVLGPLLFIIYVNDLCDILEPPELVMYADDTNILFKADTITELT